MNEKDSAEKILVDYEDVFADIVNVLLFGGKEYVKPEELVSLPVRSQYKADDSRLHEEERDVAKYWKSQGIRIAVCGIEHQSQPDGFMPARVIAYDGANYRSQLLRRNKSDSKTSETVKDAVGDGKIAPVVTLVLYFGTERWNKARTLKELFREVPEELMPYINDYRINLFEIAWLDDETIDKFKSDFKVVARHFAETRKNPDYVPKNIGELKHVDEVLKLLSVVTGDSRYEKALAIRERGESMDQALENWWQFKTQKALAEAEARGKARSDAERAVAVLKGLVDDGLITMEVAIERAGMTEQQFAEAVESLKAKTPAKV